MSYWDNEQAYGDYFHDIAVGKLPEMECSKAICNVLKKYYNLKNSLLDVACGGGHYLRSLRERVDSEINYTGVDTTKYYIEKARQAFGSDARFEEGDIFNLQFQDNEFDIVMANNVLLHLPPNPVKALGELVRVAKKSVIIRTVFGERNYVIKEVRETDEETLFNKEDPCNYNYFNLYTEKYFTETLNALGGNFKINYIKDNDFQEFDTRNQTTNTGTRLINGLQVSGNIILDWRFLVITKENGERG